MQDKITSPTLYAIYSNSRGFYLGVDRFGRHEFTKNPKYSDNERVLILKEKEMKEILGRINDQMVEPDFRLVSAIVSASFDLSESMSASQHLAHYNSGGL